MLKKFWLMNCLLLSLLLTSVAWAAQDDVAESQSAVLVDRIVVVVNEDIITASELEAQMEMVKIQLRQQKTLMPSESVLRKQVLERLIMNHVQHQIAKSMGIQVDDDLLNTTLQNIARQNSLSLAEFRDVLEGEGVDFKRFREDLRGDIVKSRLRQRNVDSRITVTDQEVNSFLNHQALEGNSDQEYRVGHILIMLPEAAEAADIKQVKTQAQEVLSRLIKGEDFAQMAVSVSDGQQALTGGDMGWRKAGELPAIFTSALSHMQPGDISELIRSSSGFHIIQLMESRGAVSHIVTQTQARHILIKTSAIVSDDDAVKQLNSLAERVKAGEDFGVLAKGYSEDPGSASNGGELGWAKPGVMVADFQTQMDALGIGELSEPFKTAFGWHIVEVMARREHDDTEGFIVAKAKEQIYQSKREEEYVNWLRRIRDEAYVEYRLDDL